MTPKLVRSLWSGGKRLIAAMERERRLFWQERQKRMWLRHLAGCQIAGDLDFSGLGPQSGRISVGRDVIIQKHGTIWLSPYTQSSFLKIEDRVFVGQNVMLVVHAAVSLGKNAMIGHYSHVTSCNHAYDRRDVPIRDQGFVGGPVTIGEDAWLGTFAVILPGVNIGKGAVVGAGSVVTHDIPAYEVWGGIPAHFIKCRE